MNLFHLRVLIFITLITVCKIDLCAQRKYSIVKVIDELRYSWDETAIALKDYHGIQTFCSSKTEREKTLKLLDDIHHWDTTLYQVVREKYEKTKDKEAEATLKDIETLEKDFTTLKFKEFIQEECGAIKIIRDDFDEVTVKQYEKAIKKFEKELVTYINIITERIDIIDEHVHHLKLD